MGGATWGRAPQLRSARTRLAAAGLGWAACARVQELDDTCAQGQRLAALAAAGGRGGRSGRREWGGGCFAEHWHNRCAHTHHALAARAAPRCPGPPFSCRTPFPPTAAAAPTVQRLQTRRPLTPLRTAWDPPPRLPLVQSARRQTAVTLQSPSACPTCGQRPSPATSSSPRSCRRSPPLCRVPGTSRSARSCRSSPQRRCPLATLLASARASWVSGGAAAPPCMLLLCAGRHACRAAPLDRSMRAGFNGSSFPLKKQGQVTLLKAAGLTLGASFVRAAGSKKSAPASARQVTIKTPNTWLTVNLRNTPTGWRMLGGCCARRGREKTHMHASRRLSLPPLPPPRPPCPPSSLC